MYQGSTHRRTIFCVPLAIAILALLAQTHAHDQTRKFFELSYPLSSKTLHWPTNSGFNYTVEKDEQVNLPGLNRSYHIKSDSFCTAAHTGTHLDAPIHFYAKGWTVDQIPLERLVDVPLTVVDLSEMVKKNKSYAFLKSDFVDKESKKSLVKANSVVLVYTGMSSLYDQGAKAYFGTDSKEISEMSIPGFSPEAAQFLVDEKVYGVGLDSPSADAQRNGANVSSVYQAHTILNGRNIYILENINGNITHLLKSQSARLTISPLRIEHGSGSPVRLSAIADHDASACHSANSATTGTTQMNIAVLIFMVLCIVPSII